jgi:hypothetical protein
MRRVRTIHLYSHPTTAPNSARQNRGFFHTVGQAFVFPVDISPCPVLSESCHNCFHAADIILNLWGHDLASALETDNNHSITNCPDIITTVVRF